MRYYSPRGHLVILIETLQLCVLCVFCDCVKYSRLFTVSHPLCIVCNDSWRSLQIKNQPGRSESKHDVAMWKLFGGFGGFSSSVVYRHGVMAFITRNSLVFPLQCSLISSRTESCLATCTAHCGTFIQTSDVIRKWMRWSAQVRETKKGVWPGGRGCRQEILRAFELCRFHSLTHSERLSSLWKPIKVDKIVNN